MAKKYNSKLLESKVKRHDKMQFEIRLRYAPLKDALRDKYAIELYFFIPGALHVNKHSYLREEFYEDMLSLIRFKTPDISFKTLSGLKNTTSPLAKINRKLKNKKKHSQDIEEELKLFANIFRSRIRNDVKDFINKIKLPLSKVAEKDLIKSIKEWKGDVFKLIKVFSQISPPISVVNKGQDAFSFANEYLSIIFEYYCTQLLEEIRSGVNKNKLKEIDILLVECIAGEYKYRKDHGFVLLNNKQTSEEKEHFLYRRGVLKKYFLDALLLEISRESISEKYIHWIGGAAAALAMLAYLLVYMWQGNKFVINSFPFIVVSVFLYVLKDRVKEGIKYYFYKQSFGWMTDFKTKIVKPSTNKTIGCLKEVFSFVSPSGVPKDVYRYRSMEGLSRIQLEGRPEKIFRYRKQVILKMKKLAVSERRQSLDDLLRFNVWRFLNKASDANEIYQAMNPKTHKIEGVVCPKVYHLNIVAKVTYRTKKLKQKIQLQRFRVVMDKDGIKRLERLEMNK